MMWVVFVQCVFAQVCVYRYKVGWRAHTNIFFCFVFLICTRLHIIRRAQTASARRRPRAAGCRRGLIGWEDESHQVLHINSWVIADTKIISSRTEAGGCGKHVTSLKLLSAVQFDELNRDVFHMSSIESVPSLSLKEALAGERALPLARKEKKTAGKKLVRLLGSNATPLLVSHYPNENHI